MKLIFVVCWSLIAVSLASAQCRETVSGDFQSKEFSAPCPVFNFSYQGVNSQSWVFPTRALDISLVADEVLPVKQRLEQQLQAYVGEEFFSKLQFKSVDISNYDSIAKFQGRYPPVDMYACKTKYFFYYHYVPTAEIKYCIGIALDDKAQIISPFNFPASRDYLPLESQLDFCKVMDIAAKTRTPITPIESVSFDFDTDKQKFFWWIKQKIVNPKVGENERNEISIEAADSGQVVSYKKIILLDADGTVVVKSQVSPPNKEPLKKIRAPR
ncbi:hypothetical protein [Flavobacterium sp. JP2137]|uniref:hypothetical protein n=1 Tax=Flavobacterium sp. JP2137 TaxID=3414510 RepID=UPI003D2FE755